MRTFTRRLAAALLGAGMLGAPMIVLEATPAAADGMFSNSTPFTIPSAQGPASVYPSTVNVPPGQNPLTDVNVHLNDLNHGSSFDIDVQLVSPAGTSVTLLSDAPGPAVSSYSNTDIIFDDEAAAQISEGSPIPSGTYKPTGTPGDTYPTPAPVGGGILLSAFDGEDPTGTWRLFIADDSTFGPSGSLAGWTVQLTTELPTAVSVVASTPTAVEGGAPGVFTFTRTGDTAGELTIASGVSGTATASDYATLGPVTFKAGDSSVTRAIAATDDGVVEPDETVTVTVVGGVDYVVGTPASATVTITDAAAPPEPVDPCAGLEDPGFTDVPESNVHLANIECLAGLEITQGGPGGRPANEYGPRLETRRDQMASFVARVAEDQGVALPTAPSDAFTDDDSSVHELAINRLAELGIVGDNGDVGSSYFPARTISREEMASFLHGLIEAVTGAPFASAEDAFTDDDGSPFEAAINALASVDIVVGTGGGLYDPDGTVQRDSMASFLVRTVQHLANVDPLEP